MNDPNDDADTPVIVEERPAAGRWRVFHRRGPDDPWRLVAERLSAEAAWLLSLELRGDVLVTDKDGPPEECV